MLKTNHKNNIPAKVIAIQNEKGGTSKSTTAATLAYLLAKRGEKVALIDFDGQGHASMLCGAKNLNQFERNLANVLFREYVLYEYVKTIKDRYSYIIIDTMPQIGSPMVNAMMCSDSIIIPTQAELFSAQGLSELLKHYNMIKHNGKPLSENNL